MSRLTKIAVLPIKYLWVIGLVFGFGFATGLVDIPGVSAQQEIECSGQVIDNECEEFFTEDGDACWNLEGFQKSVPAGYHIDESQDGACVFDGAAADPDKGQPTTTQVLGAQTFGESFGK